jgi:23S rRNA pseudouridine1911/1915/1917 synthase
MNSTPLTFFVTEPEEGMRLDQFLTTALVGAHSRSQIAQWIKQKAITINSQTITKPSYPVLTGHVISVRIPHPPLSALTPHDVPFEVLAEEKEFLIINKPAGLVVHHSVSAPHELSLVHGLLARYPEFLQFDSTERPGIVHRLDKDTSGLLLVARNPQALTALAALFKNRSIHKQYHAIVVGYPPRAGTISLPIGRDPVHRHKMSVNGIAARDATTHYTVQKYFEHSLSLLELTIVTGRTHQIRVHCSHERFPVLGDATYGTTSKYIGRQALHARKLSFTYKGIAYSYTAPYPDDFNQALKVLTSIP